MRGSAAFRTGVAPGGALAGPWVKNELYRKARAVPSLDLRFADNKLLTDAITGANLVTFTRASSGTFVGSDGLLRSAVTNLVLRSEEFDNNTSWTKPNSTITANAITAPNGTLTADKLITNNAASSGRASVSVTAVTESPATLSCFAKQGETSVFGLFISDGVTGRAADFDLITGTVSGTPTAGMTASIEAVGDGWYRCIATVTSITGTTRSLRLVQTVVANDGIKGLYIWGAQFEETSTVGEYIPTTSAINSAPRFDHNPTTGESLGLLVEDTRTNLVRNNTMVGAVAGSPGTPPTNGWVIVNSATYTSSILGTGIENGINYIDIQYVVAPGAAASVLFYCDTPAASASTAYTGSYYLKLVSGTSPQVRFVWQDGISTYNRTFFNLTATLTRYTDTLTTAISANLARFAVGIDAAPSGATFVIRVGLPQTEQGASATSVIFTDSTLSGGKNRAADVANITGTNFGTTRTNLVLRSEEFDNTGAWTRGVGLSVTPNTTISPIGTLTADTITGDPAIDINQTIAGTIGITYTNSVYVKAGTATSLMFRDDTGAGRHIVFNPSTGVITSQSGTFVSTPTSQPLANGWYRYLMTYVADSTSLRSLIRFQSAGSAQTFIAWGAQLETSSTATAYIPTTTAAVSVFESSFYNQTEGTVFADAKVTTVAPATSLTSVFALSDGTTNNRITVYKRANADISTRLDVSTSGSSVAFINAGTFSVSNLIATSYRVDDFAISLNGLTPGTDTLGAVPTISRLNIGSYADSTFPLNGTIRRLVYFPQRLPNNTLQAISQP